MRTGRILRRAGSQANLRFSSADRQFLNDLSKVGIVSEEMATAHCYADRKNGAGKPLARFTRAGLLERFSIRAPDGQCLMSYRFANDKVARAFGGRYVNGSSSRSDYHELLTSAAYYQLGRPEDFRLERMLSEADKREMANGTVDRYLLPDAIATVNGERLYIEADAGHYSKKQIQAKVSAWGDTKQYWVQSAAAKTRVPDAAHRQTIRL